MSAQRIWEENRKLISVVGASVLAAVAVQVVVVGPVSRAAERDRGAYRELSLQLEKARPDAFTYDLADVTQALKRSSEEIEREVGALTTRVKFPLPPWVEIPKEYERDPGSYFAIQHALIRDALLIEGQKAEPRVVVSDYDLGFTEILNKPLDHKNAVVNLRRLAVVDKLVRLLITSGIVEVVKITPYDPVMTGAEGHAQFIEEYPVQLLVRSRLDPLMKFLHAIRRPGEFFLVVRELLIRGRDPYAKTVVEGDEGVLQIVISSAGMLFPAEKELPGGGPEHGAGIGPRHTEGRAARDLSGSGLERRR